MKTRCIASILSSIAIHSLICDRTICTNDTLKSVNQSYAAIDLIGAILITALGLDPENRHWDISLCIIYLVVVASDHYSDGQKLVYVTGHLFFGTLLEALLGLLSGQDGDLLQRLYPFNFAASVVLPLMATEVALKLGLEEEMVKGLTIGNAILFSGLGQLSDCHYLESMTHALCYSLITIAPISASHKLTLIFGIISCCSYLYRYQLWLTDSSEQEDQDGPQVTPRWQYWTGDGMDIHM
ncbi:hypothetical protein HDE_14496 [Halotydeus destructor]|nr:hypothetical protein HDE_14496 [Halotydeus destructor]